MLETLQVHEIQDEDKLLRMAKEHANQRVNNESNNQNSD